MSVSIQLREVHWYWADDPRSFHFGGIAMDMDRRIGSYSLPLASIGKIFWKESEWEINERILALDISSWRWDLKIIDLLDELLLTLRLATKSKN